MACPKLAEQSSSQLSDRRAQSRIWYFTSHALATGRPVPDGMIIDLIRNRRLQFHPPPVFYNENLTLYYDAVSQLILLEKY